MRYISNNIIERQYVMSRELIIEVFVVKRVVKHSTVIPIV